MTNRRGERKPSLSKRPSVALVSPHTRVHTQRMPLGLMSISSSLTAAGVDNVIVDVKADSHPFASTLAAVLDVSPEIVGITCCGPEIFEVKRLCAAIRADLPDTVIVIGGPHASFPDHFIRAGVDLDYLVVGEGEHTMAYLAAAVRDGTSTDAIPNLSRKRGDVICPNPVPFPGRLSLDDLPWPAYDKVDMEYYARPSVWGIRFVLMSALGVFASRGCPYSCRFCVADTVFGKQVRRMRPQSVAAMLLYLRNRYGVDGFFFFDECFTLDRRWLDTFCSQIKDHNITWGCQTRANLINDEIVKMMKASGCIQIDFGYESGSQRMLDGMNKRTVVSQYISASKICRKNGLRQLANMMINLPGETIEDIDASIALIRQTRPNVTLWGPYLPVPGVAFGGEMQLDDLRNINQYDMLESKYKFSRHTIPIKVVLERIWREFPYPRAIRFPKNLSYYLRWLRYFSYLWTFGYWKMVFTSKRRAQYFSFPHLRRQMLMK